VDKEREEFEKTVLKLLKNQT